MFDVYRLYNSDGLLLYIGQSCNTAARIAQHRRNPDWGHRIHRVETEAHQTRAQALEAESRAIAAELPHYNILGNDWLKPVALRDCDICGQPFHPKGKHARYCSDPCREVAREESRRYRCAA